MGFQKGHKPFQRKGAPSSDSAVSEDPVAESASDADGMQAILDAALKRMEASFSEQLSTVIAQTSADLDAMRKERQELYVKLAEVESMTPQYRPMAVPDDPAEIRQAQFEENMHGMLDARAQIPVDRYGQRVNSKSPFAKGMKVRINPDVPREGFPNGVTWGSILAKAKSPGIGEIRAVLWCGKTGEWKYKVNVRGLMHPDQVDGMHGYELLPIGNR